MKPSTLRMLFVLGAVPLAGCTADGARLPGDEISLDDGTDSVGPGADSDAFSELSGPSDPDAIFDPTAMDNAAHPAVTVLEWSLGDTANGCTGTLIASNVVLTAAHCFNSDVNDKTFDVHVMIGHNANPTLRDALLDVPGIDMHTALVGSLPPTPTVTGNAANVIVHPQYVFGGVYATWDVALVVLDTSVPENLVTTIPVLDAGLNPSPPLSPSFQGVQKWNGMYAEVFGGGHTNAGCDDGAFSPIAKLDVQMFEPGFGDNGPFLQMSGSQATPGPAICFGDSGGPIVTTPNTPFGTNLPNFEIASLSSKDPGVLQGPVLNGPIRGWIVNNGLDADGDGLEPDVDNCDDVNNPGQQDTDGDGWGDACDTDDDNDDILDVDDNCPQHANPDQTDWDEDGIGWECDPNEHDLDGDHVPNADDNCPWHANSLQENCNALAEGLHFGGSDGTVFGDACDPTPCASTRMQEREFIVESILPWVSNDHICLSQLGRAVEDIVDLRPMRGTEYAAVATNDLEVWFCPCEENDAQACDDPPWNCDLSPTAATEPGSNWLPITMTDAYDPQASVSQPLATTFEPWVQFPQPTELYAWDYLGDYQEWVINQAIWTPTPNSAAHGSGTDMRGLLWVEDPTTLGQEEHGIGLCGDGDCSLSSTYIADVQPDRATTRVSCKKIPETKPPPWWTYCAACLDIFKLPYEELVNPAVLTTIDQHALLWTTSTSVEEGGTFGTALDVTSIFSEEVLSIMSKSNLTIVGPSEPVDAALQPGQARAFVLTEDASTILGQLALEEKGFELRAWDLELPMTARTGYSAAYSLGQNALFIAGGASGGELVSDGWRLDSDGNWHGVKLEPDLTPTQAVTSMWSSGDGHLWTVDAGEGQLRLLRLDPNTGEGSVAKIDALADQSEAWLVQLATHEILVVTTNGKTYQVTRLAFSDEEQTVVEFGSIVGEGHVVAAPTVKHGVLAVGIARHVGEQAWVELVDVPLGELGG